MLDNINAKEEAEAENEPCEEVPITRQEDTEFFDVGPDDYHHSNHLEPEGRPVKRVLNETLKLPAERWLHTRGKRRRRHCNLGRMLLGVWFCRGM